MTAYAEAAAVKARAGVLSSAWEEGSTPGPSEIDLFLGQVSRDLDAILRANNLYPPDTVTAGALEGVTADGTLLLMIDATWPGAAGQDAVAELRAEVVARFTAVVQSLRDGTSPILNIPATSTPKASSMWEDEPESGLPGSESWNEEVLRGTVIGPGVPPEWYRGQVL
jgi:hypothetical protein